MPAGFGPTGQLAYLYFGRHPPRSFGKEIEEVPHETEVIAGRERGIGNAHQLLALALEHRDAGQISVLAAVTHVLGEIRALVGHHGESPTATLGEFHLRVGRIRRGDHESGPTPQMVVGSVETVRPERAISAALAHVVHDEQRVLVAEQLREPRYAVHRREFVVAHLLRLDLGLQLAHLLAQLADLAAILGKLLRRLGIVHRRTPLLSHDAPFVLKDTTVLLHDYFSAFGLRRVRLFALRPNLEVRLPSRGAPRRPRRSSISCSEAASRSN